MPCSQVSPRRAPPSRRNVTAEVLLGWGCGRSPPQAATSMSTIRSVWPHDMRDRHRLGLRPDRAWEDLPGPEQAATYTNSALPNVLRLLAAAARSDGHRSPARRRLGGRSRCRSPPRPAGTDHDRDPCDGTARFRLPTTGTQGLTWRDAPSKAGPRRRGVTTAVGAARASPRDHRQYRALRIGTQSIRGSTDGPYTIDTATSRGRRRRADERLTAPRYGAQGRRADRR